MISDGRARAIGSDYANGGTSSSGTFSTTGAIADVDDLVWDLERGLTATERQAPDLVALVEYLRASGTRGPVTGWSRLWEDR
jgi:hypothetical protein